ncbi:class I SAM-dependent methyltransferase [Leadbetterella byssophila]|uniref:Methyltransferase type 12 n=1 Tax=Leadbetterella byssophila (strain DSM 17132 / JCM 16389 / KACC 11308 / NBRC 106382 / 4M15) TaxID=649349 RepID=E4RQH0_LEAB4|nr:class I SAM-dependent methyltransferase [Leadbetterella byssophila]ADQ18378.1 methyltransferase type 12 [Leadbetterella byssophila DSM 17132]
MNYGRVAKYYQVLSRMIFGDHLIHAHALAAENFPKGAKLLVLGGGDGSYLPLLKDYNIIFVDHSEQMIHLAQKHSHGQVEFHLADVFDFHYSYYDGIIVPFLLDNFNDEQCRNLIRLLPPCPIVVCDFPEKTKGLQSLLIKSMYLFFRLTANVAVSKMPSIEEIMTEFSRVKTREITLMNDFIQIKKYEL